MTTETRVDNNDNSIPENKRWPWGKPVSNFAQEMSVGKTDFLQEKRHENDSPSPLQEKADNSEKIMAEESNKQVHPDVDLSQKQNGVLIGRNVIGSSFGTAVGEKEPKTSLQSLQLASSGTAEKKDAEAPGQLSTVVIPLNESSKEDFIGGQELPSRGRTDISERPSNNIDKPSADLNILQRLKNSGTGSPRTGKKKPEKDAKTSEYGVLNARLNAINSERVGSAGNKRLDQSAAKDTESKTARKSSASVRPPRTLNESKLTRQGNDDTQKTANGGRVPSIDMAGVPADANEKERARLANGEIARNKGTRGTQAAAKNARNVKTEAAEDPEDLKEKAQALLARAVMRRVAAIKEPNNSSDKQQGSAADASATQVPAAAASAGYANGRPAHKTHSMQSLAVPGSGLVVARDVSSSNDDGEGADRASIGSRRDSVRQSMDSVSRKSMDYRLQNTQSVVQGNQSGDDKGKSMLLHDSSVIRGAIPALPLSLALLCFTSNILVPGLGTIISGFFALCCGKSRLSSKGDPVVVTLCVNVFVGVAQLGTVTFLLVGWFWSLAWGIKMVLYAVEYRKEQKQQREKELQTLALRAFGSPGTLRRSLLPPI